MTHNPHTAYVLMTPARNEERNLPRVLASIAAQTVRPLLWVIVDDGSTDRTAKIVEAFAREHHFVRLIRRQHTDERTFASKAHALRLAYKSVSELIFSFVGNLDADISFNSSFYESLIQEFDRNPALGIGTGTHIELIDREHWLKLNQPDDLALCGAQFFRRECFDDIGGYQPLIRGGVDTLAGVVARMKGWKTTSFPHIEYYHHRRMSSEGMSNVLQAYWRDGIRDQALGMHPIYALIKALSRITERPFGMASASRLAGYLRGFMLGRDPAIPDACRVFFRNEQMQRLRPSRRRLDP